jgi:predicted nucleic acid-binding protein
MVLADSGVWIDFFAGRPTAAAEQLDALLAEEESKLLIGDLILAEVLQGFRSEEQVKQALSAFDQLEQIELGGRSMALESAHNYRLLRRKGITVRSTIGCLIASFCIREGIALLHDDRDFDPFKQHLRLQVVRVGG